MNARTFNIICLAAIITVGALAITMVELSPNNIHFEFSSGAEGGSAAPLLQPLSVGVALAILLDVGLMLAGLIILFKDEPGPRSPV